MIPTHARESIEFLSTGEAAKRLGVKPTLLSRIVYRHFPNRDIPLVANRRIVPSDLLPELAEFLHQHGYISSPTATASISE